MRSMDDIRKALRYLQIDHRWKNGKLELCACVDGKRKDMPSEAELDAAIKAVEESDSIAAEVAKIRAAREAEQAALDEAEARRRLGLE